MEIFVSGAINLITFVAMLGILVFVHELGHFAVAKRLGIAVPEFGFGFPPRVWKFWQSDGWIEIQGRRIVIPRTLPVPANLAYNSQVRYKTTTQNNREVLTAIEVIDPADENVALASPVQNLDRGTEYTLNAVPLGGFVRLLGEDDPNVPNGFANAKPSVRAPILLAGVTMNFILALIVLTLGALFVPPYANVTTTTISNIAANSPAALAGLRPADTITAINRQDIKHNYPLFRQTIRASAGQPVTLTVQRGAQTFDVPVTPRANPPKNEGPLGIQLNGWVGLQITDVARGSLADQAGTRPGDVLLFFVDKDRSLRDQSELEQFTQTHLGWKVDWRIARGNTLLDPITVQIPTTLAPQDAALGLNLRLSPLAAPGKALSDMWTMLTTIPLLFAQLFEGSAPANAFVGPIGIARVTGEVAQRGGWLALLQLTGLLSLNLAVVNLLPFPGLDGGRLVFAALEWLRRGKRIDPQKEGVVHLIGLVILVGLMVIISYFDVLSAVSGQPIIPTP